MGKPIYVVWTGREKGDSQSVHTVPVPMQTPHGPMPGVQEIHFRRDYLSGRMMWVGDSETDAAAIDFYMRHADPEYFAVYDTALPEDDDHFRNMFMGGIELTGFVYQLARMVDIDELRHLFAKMHKCGINPDFMIPVANRIETLEENAQKLATHAQRMGAGMPQLGAPMQQGAAPAAPPPPPADVPAVKGKRKAAEAVAA